MQQGPTDAQTAKLDRLVAAHAGISRRQARLLIAGGRVRVDGRAVRILTRPVRLSAALTVDPAPPLAATSEPPSRPPAASVRLLHLDRAIVVVDKPAGLLSEPDRFGAPALEDAIRAQLAAAGEPDALWLVHRLDAGTSGAMVLARTPAAARSLYAAFAARAVDKRYLALCAGHLAAATEVDAPIGRVRGTRHGVLPDGRPSRTRVRPRAAICGGTWVEAMPLTGRTHQIRVHLAHIGHPLLGDRLYGGPGYGPGPLPRPIARPMLHAWQLAFAHPRSGAPMRFEVPWPADFAALTGNAP